ncbi:hypothetical protein IAT38_007089 [Cryptococcus sp. DSM 104549]
MTPHIPVDFSAEIKWLKSKLRSRHGEQEYGLYLWETMFDLGRPCRPDARPRDPHDIDSEHTGRLDVADYTAPVTPKEVGHCGRGLVTTRDVKAGELLLVFKAIIINWPADYTENGDEEERSSDEERSVGESGTILPQLATQAVVLLIHELDNNPAVGPIVVGLSSQDNPSLAILPDLTLAKTEVEQSVEILGRGANRHQINITELHRIYENNYLSGPMFAEMLFGLPSLVNHPCLSNTSVTYWNDVVVFRATSDLPKGTEVLDNYIPIGYPIHIRSQDLYQWNILKCECFLCQADREDLRNVRTTDVANREHKRGISTSNSLGLSVDPQTECVGVETYRSMRDRLETRMEKARARGRREPMLDLASEWATLSTIVPHLDIMQVIDCRKKSLICAGFVFTDPVIHGHNRMIHSIVTGDDDIIFLMEAIAALHVRLHDFDEVDRWVEAAQWVHNIHYGGGTWLFEQRWNGLNWKELLGKFGY